MEIRTRGADVKLDFTEAVITHDTLHIDLDVGPGGDLTLVIKPGIVVDADDVKATLGDIKIRPGRASGRAGHPARGAGGPDPGRGHRGAVPAADVLAVAAA